MGEDKAFIELDGVPLWRRQFRKLEELQPREIFISGPAHKEWLSEGCVIVDDAEMNAGPLAGLIATLRHCSAPLLLTLAVDLPNMTADYLRALLGSCSETRGVVTRGQPLAAVYPANALPQAERCLESGDHSMQKFAMRCAADGLVRLEDMASADQSLFLNMNTPEDLVALHDVSRVSRPGGAAAVPRSAAVKVFTPPRQETRPTPHA